MIGTNPLNEVPTGGETQRLSQRLTISAYGTMALLFSCLGAGWAAHTYDTVHALPPDQEMLSAADKSILNDTAFNIDSIKAGQEEEIADVAGGISGLVIVAYGVKAVIGKRRF